MLGLPFPPDLNAWQRENINSFYLVQDFFSERSHHA